MAQTIGSIDLNAFSGLYSDSTQYFWFESNASATYGAGAHVTLVPDTTFISNPTGQNILMNTDGFSIRNGLLPMMTLDSDSLDFNVVDTIAGTYTTTATFTTTGAQIGQSGGAHSVIDTNGQRFYATNGTTQLANIGYDAGVNATGGSSVAPYYTFGIRYSDTSSTRGNYSVAEGYETEARGAYSHAEGWKTSATKSSSHAEGDGTDATGVGSHAEGVSSQASGYGAHAEGASDIQYNTTASGDGSHAEGKGTKASGTGSHSEGSRTIASGTNAHAEGEGATASAYNSHAEGFYSEATAQYSHAQNRWTKASKDAQTTIGTYNIEDIATTTTHPSETTSYGQYAFIIGNGTSDNDRSNALTVDWSGNVEAAGELHGSNIGDFKSDIPTSVSCATGRYYQAASLELEPGVWMIDMNAAFPSTNTTGFREIRCTTVDSGYNNVTTAPAAFGNITMSRLAGANHQQYPQAHFPVRVSTTMTYRLIVYQTSGSTINVTGRMYAVRIK